MCAHAPGGKAHRHACRVPTGANCAGRRYARDDLFSEIDDNQPDFAVRAIFTSAELGLNIYVFQSVFLPSDCHGSILLGLTTKP